MRTANDVMTVPLTGALALVLALALGGPAMETAGLFLAAGSRDLARGGYLLALLIAIVAVRPRAAPGRLMTIPAPFFLAFAWFALSLGWSSMPDIGARRLLLTATVVATLFLCVRQLGNRRTLAVVRIALAVALVANLAAVAAMPDVAIHNHANANAVHPWRALMGHKNNAGLFAALTIVFFAFDRRRLPIAAQAAAILGAGVLLWFSVSRTAMVVVAAALVVGGLFAAAQPVLARALLGPRRPALRATGLALAALLAVLLVYLTFVSDWLATIANDPSQLTGRVAIWQPLLAAYLHQPLTGVGFGSFWGQAPVEMVLSIDGARQRINDGHNGYLDLAVQVGLPGLLLALFAVLVWPMRAWARRVPFSRGTAALVLAVLVLFFAHNLTETSLFERDALGQVFATIALGMIWNLPQTHLRVASRRRRQSAAPEGDGRT